MAAPKRQVAGQDRLLRAAELAREARRLPTTADGYAKAVGAARAEVTPAGLLALQRNIGNRATVALLQRDLEDEDVEAAAAMFQQAEAQDPATYLPLEWNVKTAAELGPERAAKFRQLVEARQAGPKKVTGGLGDEDVEAAAAVSKQAEFGPGAARGREALRGLVAQSGEYNKPRKQNLPLVWNVKFAAELGPERAAKYRQLFEARQARQKKTTTAGGAFIASQVNSKEKIGSAAAYTTPAEREGHLGEFLRGSHAFVPDDAYLKIRGQHLSEANFNAWGAGTNFVAPLADADKLVAEASAEGGRGLFHLEKALGIPPMSWVKQCEKQDYGIWRFKILKPEALNLRIPSGSEYGAYGSWVDKGGAAHRGEWRPGGLTLGGAKEAVIDQVGAGKFGEKGDNAGLATRNKLAELEKDGILMIELDKSMSANTKRVLQEKGPPA